ncbi:MAG: antitoxin VapB family protein [Promethearchaeota archaeon]
MASKTIMIQEETYNLLVKLKKKSESFNDVILRIIREHQDFTPYFGIFTENEGNKIEKEILETRKILDKTDELRGDGF